MAASGYIKLLSHDINTFDTILSMFDGKHQFVIEHPEFKNNNSLPEKMKLTQPSYMKMVTSPNKGKYFTGLPHILLKAINGQYTNKFVIAWKDEGDAGIKTFRFMSLFGFKDPLSKTLLPKAAESHDTVMRRSKNKITVTPIIPNIDILSTGDRNLVTLTHQLSIGIEICFLTSLANISIGGFHDDESLMNAISDAFSSKNDKIVIDESFYESFRNPVDNYNNETMSIINNIAATIHILKSNCPSEHVTKLVQCDGKQLPTTNNSLQIMDYTKGEVTRKVFNSKLVFTANFDQSDKPKDARNNTPVAYMTHFVPGKNMQPRVMTPEDVLAITASDTPGVMGTTQRGILYIRPQVAVKFYMKASIGIDWEVSKYILSPVEYAGSIDVEDDPSDVDSIFKTNDSNNVKDDADAVFDDGNGGM
jgi:hypothetical protein